jgi:hypothetical protein
LQHLLTGDAAALERALIYTPELPFHEAVIITQLLLLDQTEAVIGMLAARLGAVHAGTVIPALKIFRGAEDRRAKTAADANAGTCITSHML